MPSFASQERQRQDRVAQDRVARVAHALRQATRLTPALFSTVVTGACMRFGGTGQGRHAGRLAHLVLTEAWNDASLFLIEVELPQWRVRRLVYDGGEWTCALSRYPGLPVEYDPAADGRHATMAIAILLSLLEAKGQTAAALTGTSSVACTAPAIVDPMCCDDFR